MLNQRSKRIPLKIILIIILSFYIGSKSIAQDFTNFYIYIDSIEYYNSINTVNSDKKSDNLYRKCFNEYRAFPGVYSSAIITSFKANNSLCDTLIVAAFREGALKQNIKYDLDKNGIHYSKRNLNKLKRKGKKQQSRKINAFPIYRMIVKDQFARTRRKVKQNIQQTDSLNAIKLRELLKTKPDLFNRNRTTPLAAMLLEILLFHGDWKNIEPIQTELYELTKKGFISRNVLAYLIERNAISDGYEFRIDPIQKKIISTKNLADSVCHGYYSSIAYEWGGIRDTSKNRIVLPPLHPNLRIEEVNDLRHFLFLSDLNLLYKTGKYYSAKTVEEYCLLLEAKFMKQKMKK
jgi:hypothetical protein